MGKRRRERGVSENHCPRGFLSASVTAAACFASAHVVLSLTVAGPDFQTHMMTKQE